MEIEMVKLRYKGGRTLVNAAYNRKYYPFNKNNDYVNEIPLGLAKQLLLTGEYIPAKEEKPIVKEDVVIDKLVCIVCGFKAKSEFGMIVHSRKHIEEEK